MRKIKFRGVRTCDNVYIYGDLRHSDDGETFINNWRVNPDSVSQFTGAYDCNGTEIYDGDICEYEGYHSFVIKWDIYERGFMMFRFNGEKSPVQFHGEFLNMLKVK